MALVIRPARTDDKPALMDIARRVWDGDDYLPVFFDRWVREGGFWVGEKSGRVVGCGKATHFGAGKWWLEGLRVDPDMQGHGFGTEMSLGILARVLKKRPRSLRLSTAEVNRESIHIIGRMGFVPLFAARYFRGARSPVGKRGTVPGRLGAAAIRDNPGFPPARVLASEALAYLARQEETWLKSGLLSHTWKFKEIAPRYLMRVEREGNLLGVRERGRLSGLLVVQPHLYEPRNLDIGFVSGTRRALALFKRHIESRLAASGGRQFDSTAAGPKMYSALVALGMKPSRGFGRVIVFEYIGRPSVF